MKKKMKLGKVALFVVVFLTIFSIYTIASFITKFEFAVSDELDDISTIDYETSELELSDDTDNISNLITKDELISEYTEKLKNNQNRTIKYGEFIDEFHYVYVLTDQVQHTKEKIMIVYLGDSEVQLLFEAGILDDEISKNWEIKKLHINKLKDKESSNVSVVLANDKYIKVQVFEVNEENHGIRYSGFYKVNNEIGKSFGDEGFKYILDLEDEASYTKLKS